MLEYKLETQNLEKQSTSTSTYETVIAIGIIGLGQFDPEKLHRLQFGPQRKVNPKRRLEECASQELPIALPPFRIGDGNPGEPWLRGERRERRGEVDLRKTVHGSSFILNSKCCFRKFKLKHP